MKKNIKIDHLNPYDLNTLTNKQMKEGLPNFASKRSLDIFAAGGKNTTTYVKQSDSKDKKK